jgi:hypothetical protein
MRTLAAFVLSATLVVPAVFAQEAEQPPVESSKTFGPYEIHYSVVPTAFINEATAAAYQITRAKDQAMVNVSVRKQGDDGDAPQAATVKGTYSDLMQSKPLNFREVREQGAIYYIATFRHGDKELLRFDLSVQVDPQLPAQKISFTRKLFVDE